VLNDHIPSLAHTALSERLCVSLRPPSSNGPYPTSKIQKGPVLVCGSVDLSGEGVGLGVPIAKFAHHVFFPRKACVIERLTDDQLSSWIVDYELNLEERLTLKSGKKIQSKNFYALKELFAGLHKTIGASRGLIEYSSSALRRTLGLSTTFELTRSVGNVRVSYTINRRARMLRVSVDASGLNKTGCSEMILLNELDGGLFDRYCNSNGVARRQGDWNLGRDRCGLRDAHRLSSQHSAPPSERRSIHDVSGTRSGAGPTFLDRNCLYHRATPYGL